MEGKKDEHRNILETILKDQNNSVPKFLATIIDFMDNKTTFGYHGKEAIKKHLTKAVDTHYTNKDALRLDALKRKSTDLPSVKLATVHKDSSDNESKFPPQTKRPKINFINPKTSKF